MRLWFRQRELPEKLGAEIGVVDGAPNTPVAVGCEGAPNRPPDGCPKEEVGWEERKGLWFCVVFPNGLDFAGPEEAGGNEVLVPFAAAIGACVGAAVEVEEKDFVAKGFVKDCGCAGISIFIGDSGIDCASFVESTDPDLTKPPRPLPKPLPLDVPLPLSDAPLPPRDPASNVCPLCSRFAAFASRSAWNASRPASEIFVNIRGSS
jgi:hypothetical protein